MAVEHQSSRSTYVIIAAFVAIAVAGFWWTWGRGDTQAAQQKKKGPVVISVLAGKAQKKDVPYRVESLGTVQPLVTVSIRSRVDSQVLKVHFEDGAKVNEGDPLFTLDSRAPRLPCCADRACLPATRPCPAGTSRSPDSAWLRSE